jgi:hypothetical protein
MDLEQFVKKNVGQKVDFDGYCGAQCVDLPRQYWKDVCGIKERLEPCSTSGGAKDLFLDYDKMPKEKKYLKRGTRGFIAGDVLVWNSNPNNKYGHVAIFLGFLGDSLIVFEQDGFKQDGAKINLRTNKNLLGYLRKK